MEGVLGNLKAELGPTSPDKYINQGLSVLPLGGIITYWPSGAAAFLRTVILEGC